MYTRVRHKLRIIFLFEVHPCLSDYRWSSVNCLQAQSVNAFRFVVFPCRLPRVRGSFSSIFRNISPWKNQAMSGKNVHEFIVGPITCFSLDKDRKSMFLNFLILSWWSVQFFTVLPLWPNNFSRSFWLHIPFSFVFVEKVLQTLV